jgi:hypothetical protein
MHRKITENLETRSMLLENGNHIRVYSLPTDLIDSPLSHPTFYTHCAAEILKLSLIRKEISEVAVCSQTHIRFQ